MGDASRPQVLIIAGPGGIAFGSTDVDDLEANLKAAGAQVTRIGDAIRPVTLEDIKTAVAKLHAGPVTIFMETHGDEVRGRHMINLDGSFNIPTADFFTLIAQARNGQPTDVFMTACHGAGANAAAVTNLPSGSTFVTLARAGESVIVGDVWRLTDSLATTSSFGAEGLLYTYLVQDLQSRVTPSITIADRGTVDLKEIFIAHAGRAFTLEERANVYQRLQGIADKRDLDRMMNEIGVARDPEDISALDYGKALAVSYAAMSSEQLRAHHVAQLPAASGAGDQFMRGLEQPLQPRNSVEATSLSGQAR